MISYAVLRRKNTLPQILLRLKDDVYKRVLEKSLEKQQSNQSYIRELISNDINNRDITKEEQKVLYESSGIIAEKIINKISDMMEKYYREITAKNNATTKELDNIYSILKTLYTKLEK
jgi:hypothetical protein